MAFPTTLTDAIDGVTDIVAAHLNSLEAKVGIDNSMVPTSLDYLLKSPSSIDPGHKHSKLWASDGSTQAVTVDAAGNVGFGTENPEATLHVNRSVNSIGGSIYSSNSSTGTGATAYIGLGGSGPNGYLDIYQFGGSYTTSGQYVQNSGLIQSRSAAGLGISAVDAAGTIRFYTAGSSERMRIDAGGNVGIGTTAPGKKLDVNGYVRGVGVFNTLNSAPADGDLAAGECAWWFDKTDGAAKLMIKAKQNDGTVKTGEVSLN